MYDTLKEVLQRYVGEDRQWVMLEAYVTMNKLGKSSQDTELLTIFGLPDEMTNSELFLSRIDACLTYGIGGCLNEYGMVVKDGTPLTVMTSILTAVGTFEGYQMEQCVLDLLTDDDRDDIEKMAAFIPMYSDLEEVDVLEYLVEVRKATMTRLVNIVQEELNLQAVAQAPCESRPDRVNKINTILRDGDHAQPELVRQLASSGIPMETPITQLVEMYLTDLDSILDTETLALELFMLALYADPDFEGSLQAGISYFSDDYDEKIKIRHYVDKYMYKKGWGYYVKA
jgi:hypothetical protein